jgi:hypothetical protein
MSVAYSVIQSFADSCITEGESLGLFFFRK